MRARNLSPFQKVRIFLRFLRCVPFHFVDVFKIRFH